MRIVHTFFIILAVNLNSIECSSWSAGNPNSRNQRDYPSSSAAHEQHSPDQRSPVGSPARYRSRSPDRSSLLLRALGYSLEELGFLRLTPRTNDSLLFEFRRCIFPEGIHIRLRDQRKRRVPVPTREQIVLSLSNGDVFAVLEYSGTLRGIYATNRGYSRIKVNIMSGEIHKMTPDEMKVCPLGKNFPIFPYSFIKSFANDDSLQNIWNIHFEPEDSSLQNRPSYDLGRPPSDRILGHAIAELGYIRLIPLENQHRRFEFRRYVIPADKPIRLRLGNTYILVPIQEHIVLSTSNGDVFAILEHTGFLRAIYTSNNLKERVKLNMMSGAVSKMTASEQKECHVGTKFPIFPRWFTEEIVDEDSLRHVYH